MKPAADDRAARARQTNAARLRYHAKSKTIDSAAIASAQGEPGRPPGMKRGKERDEEDGELRVRRARQERLAQEPPVGGGTGPRVDVPRSAWTPR